MGGAGPSLREYRARRDFHRSPEPQGDVAPSRQQLSFVVQRHAARRLHYDLRLEWQGVLKSWAVARGPSLDPADKRLAVEVEDHPLDYAAFEGVIPAPGYGAGTVQLWDRGAWAPLDPARVEEDLERGELKFVLAGERLRGGFVLVRMKPRAGAKPEARRNWLLIKERDSMARPGEGDAVLRDDASIATGRTLQQIAKGKTASAHEPVPGFVPPQLCRLVVAPPIGPEWTHEMKLDGYRLQLRVVGGRATLKTRTGLDWTPRFPTIAEAATRLPDALIDGEAVALDANGQPSFAALQQRLAGEGNAPIVFFAFDLLHDGKADLRARPLRERKAALHALLPARRGSTLRYVEDFPAPGAAVLASACKLSMEGVVSKLRDGPYVSGREGGWTKAKCKGRDEFVIGAWSAGASGHGLGALLLGVRGEAGLTYVGRVGTGFSGAVAQDLLRRLRLLRAGASPFHGRQPPRKAGVTWVEPELVAEIEYGGWTEDGILRHASFQGLREDKPAAEVTAPMPEPPPPKRGGRGSAPPRITHPERVIWPATETSPAITKGELAAHYARFAPLILPHVAGRPLSVLRAPEGIGAETFFQRHAMRGQSPLIGAVTIEGQPRPFMRIDDAAGLAALAQVSAVELHPWGSLAARPDEPDRLVFDLDPAPDLAFAQVVEAARELKARLEAVGLEAFPRVTGGKGLHLVVPLAAGPGSDAPPNWIAAKQFAKLVCTLMERDSPERYTTSMSKRQRTGRIFLDYLRNDRLSTAIANFSPRARPGAPVAYPLTWRAVTPGLDPAGFRLAALAAGPLPRDAWADFSAAARPLLDAIRRITRTA